MFPVFNLSRPGVLIALILITLVGAFLRINASLQTEVLNPLRADAGDYFSYAYNLRHNSSYSRHPSFINPLEQPPPDALRSPGYPLVLMPLIDATPTGKTIIDITIMQAILGILMIPMVFFLSRAVLPEKWALLPAFLVAISPQLIVMGTYILTESLFTFLLLLTLISIQIQFKKPTRWHWAIISGMLMGMASLTRPTLQYFLPVILVCIFFMMPAVNRKKQAVAITLGFLIMFSPWLIRNYLTLGVLSDPHLKIYTLLHGHYPDFMYQGRPETLGYPYRFDPHAEKIGTSVANVIHEIYRLFVSEPLTYLRWYFVGKPIAFFSWTDVAAWNEIFTYPTLKSPFFNNNFYKFTKGMMQLSHAFWMITAVLSSILIWKRSFLRSENPELITELKLLSCMVFYFVAIHIAGFPISRYSIPLLPIMFILATLFLSKGVRFLLYKLSIHPKFAENIRQVKAL